MQRTAMVKLGQVRLNFHKYVTSIFFLNTTFLVYSNFSGIETCSLQYSNAISILIIWELHVCKFYSFLGLCGSWTISCVEKES